MATRAAPRYNPSIVQGSGIVPSYNLERFRPHRVRVLNLYKQGIRTINTNWLERGTLYRGPDSWHEHYERVLLRARFDQNKSITSLAKATELLKGNLLQSGAKIRQAKIRHTF